jgi:hypothetical protein
LLVPLALCLLGIVSSRFASPGVRFRTAVLGGFVLDICGTGVIYASNLPMDGYDLLAAISLVVASVLLSFIAWSLIAWGFTLNMLLELAAVSRPIDETVWVNLYTQGGGYRRLTSDRMGILLAARLAMRDQDRYTVTPAGKAFAKILRLLQSAFGIDVTAQKAGA